MRKYSGPLWKALKKRFGDENRAFNGLLDDEVDTYLDRAPFPINSVEVEEACQIALRAMTSNYMRDFYHGFYSIINKCESPIEAMMVAALILLSAEKNICLEARVNDFHIFLTNDSLPKITITPQSMIGEFRVDFFLEYEDIIPDFENEVISKSGKNIPGTIEVKTNIVVECDGHDFHEKTKEQAKKDKKRDRTFQSLGYNVFRFTGSEIWQDPINCAEEILSQLEK